MKFCLDCYVKYLLTAVLRLGTFILCFVYLAKYEFASRSFTQKWAVHKRLRQTLVNSTFSKLPSPLIDGVLYE